MKKIVALVLIFAMLGALSLVGCGEMDKFYVSYDKQDGSVATIKSQRIKAGESGLVSKPDDPVKDDYIFEGWFKEPACINEWDFDSDTLKGGDRITLYAKFTPIETENPNPIAGFYRLQEAYDLGLLAYEDLFEASFYHNGDWNGVPNGIAISRAAYPKTPEFLSAETENKIKQDFLDKHNLENGSYDDCTLNDVTISNYCGTYNGAVVVMLDGLYDYGEALWSETVEDITFYYGGNYLRVWIEEESKELNAQGHFFRMSFGGSLINFPFEEYPANHYNSAVISMTDKTQMDIFSETYSQSWSEEEGNWVKDNRFSDLIDSYDDDFFKDNRLITFFAVASGGAYYFEFSRAVYSDGVLIIEINHISAGAGHDAEVDWFAIIEVEKIPADTEIVIKIINRNW